MFHRSSRVLTDSLQSMEMGPTILHRWTRFHISSLKCLVMRGCSPQNGHGRGFIGFSSGLRYSDDMNATAKILSLLRGPHLCGGLLSLLR